MAFDSVLVKTGRCLVRLSLGVALPLPLSMSDKLGLSSDLPIDWKFVNSVVRISGCWASSLCDFCSCCSVVDFFMLGLVSVGCLWMLD